MPCLSIPSSLPVAFTFWFSPSVYEIVAIVLSCNNSAILLNDLCHYCNKKDPTEAYGKYIEAALDTTKAQNALNVGHSPYLVCWCVSNM
jgi:hypothetical protein